MKSEVVDSIKEYLVEHSTNPFADSEYMIIRQRGVLQRDAINTMLEKLTVKIGIDVRLKPHIFRRTFYEQQGQCSGIPVKEQVYPAVTKASTNDKEWCLIIY